VSTSVPILSVRGRFACVVSPLGRTDDVDARHERTIGELLGHRRREASICPSDAARAVDPTGWRDLMPAARAVAGVWSRRAR
jgi:hypothetical protein